MSRSLALVVFLLTGACGEPGPPDTPEAREAIAVCGVPLTHGRVPDEQVRAALAAASKLATVSRDMREVTSHYGGRDLAEQGQAIAAAAAAAGVRRCPLAEGLDALATAAPTAEDIAGAINVLEAVPTVSPEFRIAVLAAGCAEIPACGRECVPGLSVLPALQGAQRVQSLAGGCAEFRAKVAGGEPALEAFVRARVAAFLDACVKEGGPSAARIEAMRGGAML